MKEKITIIGGGLGGLFTGSLLSRLGYTVTVLEKNHIIGGGLQTFTRYGQSFETGMHILGGLREGGSIHKICSFLGIADRLNVCDVDGDCIDTIIYGSDGREYRIPRGRENFTAYLSSLFPSEAEGLRRYVDRMYALANEVDMFYLRKEADSIFGHDEEFLLPADEFIARYISDIRLRDILGYMNPMYAGMRGHTPAYIHCLINVLYIAGPSRFVGGSQQMADLLRDVITGSGGEVRNDSEVVRVACSTELSRRVDFVEDKKGNRYVSDYYISAIHPQSLLEICDEGAFPKAFVRRVSSLPNTYSCFVLFLIFHPDSFPYINHTGYYQDDYGIVWDYGIYDDRWPRGMMYMTPCDTIGQTSARKMIVNAPMPYEVVKQWENTVTGHRGEDYERWKTGRAEKIIDKLERIFPYIRSKIKTYFSASPLTIRDYYNDKEGALYGIRKDSQNIVASQVPVFSKISNLLFTGQNVNLHGICGVPLTAVNTVEAIIGRGRLIDMINENYEKKR